MLVALTPPNFTPVVVLTVHPPPLKPDPVITTGVPPPVGPDVGLIAVTVGVAPQAANAAGMSNANGAANAPITIAARNPPSARRARVPLESRPLDESVE